MVSCSRRPAAYIFLSLLLAFCASGQTENNDTDPKLVSPGPPALFGFDMFTVTETDIKDTKTAIEFYLKELGKNIQVSGDTFANAKSRIYENYHDMARDVKNGTLSLGHVSALHYLQMGIESCTELSYSSKVGGSRFRKYYLITQADSAIDDISQLEHKSIALMKTNNMGDLYLDVELLKRGKKEAPQFFSTITEKRLFSQVVLSVFFGQTDAGLCTDASFETAVELNPQVGKKLKIVSESPSMLNMVGFYRNDWNPRYKEIAMEEALSLKNTEYGRMVLVLFHIDDLEQIQAHDLDSLKELLRNYKQLGGQDTSFTSHVDTQ